MKEHYDNYDIMIIIYYNNAILIKYYIICYTHIYFSASSLLTKNKDEAS